MQLDTHEPNKLLAFLSTCNGPRGSNPETAAARLRVSKAGNCGCCRGSGHSRESEKALVLWCPATETRSSGGAGFPGAELASAWGCGGCEGCSSGQGPSFHVLHGPIPAPERRLLPRWSVLVSAQQRIRAFRRAFMEQIGQL